MDEDEMMSRNGAAPRGGTPRGMRAWVLRDFGSADAFEPAEIPVPDLPPGHVLLRVAATSVNPADIKIRDGRSAAIAPPAPRVLHMDVAGVVAAATPDVGGFSVGDRVYGCAGGLGNVPGALADFMAADARLLAHAPKSLPLVHAAALPLAALTAWEGLRWKVRVRRGERVLVHGATGGVGHLALQLARMDGAEVTATASSPEKLEIARELGAAHTVNYREEQVPDYVERITGGRGFDVVFDTAGGAALNQSLEAARMNGAVVSILTRGSHDLGVMLTRGLSLHSVFMLIPLLTGEGRERHGAMLREIAEAVDSGRLRPLLDPATFTFDEAAAAHRHVEGGRHVGKVVLAHPTQAGA